MILVILKYLSVVITFAVVLVHIYPMRLLWTLKLLKLSVAWFDDDDDDDDVHDDDDDDDDDDDADDDDDDDEWRLIWRKRIQLRLVKALDEKLRESWTVSRSYSHDI